MRICHDFIICFLVNVNIIFIEFCTNFDDDFVGVVLAIVIVWISFIDDIAFEWLDIIFN